MKVLLYIILLLINIETDTISEPLYKPKHLQMLPKNTEIGKIQDQLQRKLNQNETQSSEYHEIPISNNILAISSIKNTGKSHIQSTMLVL